MRHQAVSSRNDKGLEGVCGTETTSKNSAAFKNQGRDPFSEEHPRYFQ
jgi:hypothetical protein